EEARDQEDRLAARVLDAHALVDGVAHQRGELERDPALAPDRRQRWELRRPHELHRTRPPPARVAARTISMPGIGSRLMLAATIRDGEVRTEEHPDPEPGSGEILVRARAAGLNGADMLQRRGRYPAPPGSPQDIPGLELAGEVAALGPGAMRFEEGDRVMGVVGGGGQAELAVVHERQLMPVPERLAWPQA